MNIFRSTIGIKRTKKERAYKLSNNCPSCKSVGEFYDGDSIAIDKSIKGSLDDAYFEPTLNLYQCTSCKKYFYLIELSFVNNPSVSEEWINRYFHYMSTDPIEEPKEFFIVTYDEDDLVFKWPVTQQNTSEGILNRHFFGPFVPESNLVDSNGVSRCTGHPEWKKAAGFIRDIFPIVERYFPFLRQSRKIAYSYPF